MMVPGAQPGMECPPGLEQMAASLSLSFTSVKWA